MLLSFCRNGNPTFVLEGAPACARILPVFLVDIALLVSLANSFDLPRIWRFIVCAHFQFFFAAFRRDFAQQGLGFLRECFCAAVFGYCVGQKSLPFTSLLVVIWKVEGAELENELPRTNGEMNFDADACIFKAYIEFESDIQ